MRIGQIGLILTKIPCLTSEEQNQKSTVFQRHANGVAVASMVWCSSSEFVAGKKLFTDQQWVRFLTFTRIIDGKQTGSPNWKKKKKKKIEIEWLEFQFFTVLLFCIEKMKINLEMLVNLLSFTL